MKTVYTFYKQVICFLVLVVSMLPVKSQTTIITYNSQWKYLDGGTDPGATWTSTTFNDGSWPIGTSEFGYGNGGETTTIDAGCTPVSSCTTKFITTYFRKTFSLTGRSNYINFTLNVLRDDGIAIYVNGIMVASDNISTSGLTNTTLASTDIDGASETTPISFTIDPCAFQEGTNTIAVELHQFAANTPDASFNMELIGNPLTSVPTLTRGPYLVVGTETGVTIRWRTDIACYGRVQLGNSFGSYTLAPVDEICPTKEHIVAIGGLTPDTKYYYTVGASNGTVLQALNTNFFSTLPTANTTRKVRISVFGDCGRRSSLYQDDNLNNYKNWLSANSIDAPDAWLLLGDNAYEEGTDEQYTSNFFNIYDGSILQNHKIFPAPGNHDYANNGLNKTSRTLPYYTNFSVPQNGESGGIASHKQSYYSFNVGNIHFLSLDSYGVENGESIETNSNNTELKNWISSDLAANTKKWIVAYWHHPPYTKSGHNSDVEPDLINIRQNFISFLENRGVDLIICGHSHAYERSYLLSNFTGNWDSFNPATHAKSTSSGSYSSATTCPYVYNGSAANHGTVYVLAGSAGAAGGTNIGFGTNAMPFAVNDGGLFYFEVQGNRLDAKMLQRNGTIFDQFTIVKDANKTTNFTILDGTSQTLTASWPGNYSWNTFATTQSITVTPPMGINNYTVTDNFGCITDHFAINVTSVLPVNLLDYSVLMENEKVNCKWSTASEENSRLFTLERSSSANSSFQFVDKLNAAQHSNTVQHYTLVDQSPLPGISYYRLSQTDMDGHIKYYEAKRIVNNNTTFSVQQMESTGSLMLHIKTFRADKLLLKVFDASGKRITADRVSVASGDNIKEITLRPGSYVWQISNSRNEKISRLALVK